MSFFASEMKRFVLLLALCATVIQATEPDVTELSIETTVRCSIEQISNGDRTDWLAVQARWVR